MHNNKNCIYIYSMYSIINPEALKVFENFSVQNSVLLYSTLIANYIEILFRDESDYDLIYCLNKQDENNLPANFLPVGSRVLFSINDDSSNPFDKLAQNYFPKYENNLLLRADTIGLTLNNVNKIFNLLKIEDDVLVVGKSDNDRITFGGFNSVDIHLLEKMFSSVIRYDELLIEAGKRELFINTLPGGQVITEFNDFKDLYINLSKKESLSYCSQEMHERFTNLFIEYKDLLK